MFVRKQKKSPPKLNLIPILDSVFIFIFFLLMSTQFIEIYQIGSEVPSIKTVDTQKDNDDEPLNLTLKISENEIQIMTGVPLSLYESISLAEGKGILELQKKLWKIKGNNNDENTVRLRPNPDVSYEHIVKIIDASRKIHPLAIEKLGLSDNVDNTRPNRVNDIALFENIIFESVI